MTTTPKLVRPLASYPDREEFQIDRTLVWVAINAPARRAETVTKADQLLPAIWSAVPEIIAAAEAVSRVDMPAFWIAHDAAGTSSQQLSVWGIWITPETGAAKYEVGLNHFFATPKGVELPCFPEEMGITVARSADGSCTAHVVHERRSPYD